MEKELSDIWKVVGWRQGKPISHIAGGYLEITYRLGEVSRPKVGYLFGFATRQHAINYAGSGEGVLKGKGVIEATWQDIPWLLNTPETLPPSNVELFWENPVICALDAWDTPEGTVFLSEFIPLSVVA